MLRLPILSLSNFAPRLVIFLTIVLGAVSSPAGDAAGDRVERAFLRQLTERLFFNLAEQHCREMLAEAVSVDEQGQWQLRLSRTTVQHAWFADASSRPELLNRSVEVVTDFLNNKTPSAELNLQLRLQQISALCERVRFNLVLAEAGHLFGRRVSTAERKVTQPLQQKDSRGHQATIDHGIELSSALLKQLEKIREELNPDVVQQSREHARLLLSELHLLNWRINSDTPRHQQLLSTAETAISTAVRSSRIARHASKAAWLLAELKLYSDGSESFQLHAGTLKTSSDSDDVPPGQFLVVRDLLFRKEAAQAVELIDQAKQGTALQRQQFQWLKLEALLGLRELAGQLQDEHLVSRTSANFAAERERIQPFMRGVFADAVEVVNRRFELVDEVGTEIADLIEQIEWQRQTGDEIDALRLIDVTLQRLPPKRSDRPRAALQLRAGEILVRQRKWSEAITRLTLAASLFETTVMRAEQAAADLLKIFAMSQLVGRPASESGQSQSAYVSALEQHLSRFPDESTAGTASDWLRQVVNSTQPLRAAELALNRFETEEDRSTRIRLLIEASESLQNAALDPADEKAEALRRQLRNHVSETLTTSRDLMPVIRQVQLELILLEASLSTANFREDQWQKLESRASQLKQLLEGTAETKDDSDLKEKHVVAFRLQLMEIAIGARTTSERTRLTELHQRAMAVDDDQLMRTIRFLDVQVSQRALQAGDTWLAELNTQLLKRMLDNRNVPPSVDELLWMSPVAARAARLSGDTEVLDRLLNQATTMSITEQQLSRLAQSLSFSDASNSQAQEDAVSAGARKKFWQQVLAARPQGTDTWLEASLQLAELSARSGAIEAARRRLHVVEALYPDWGTPQRKARTQTLYKRLEQQ